LRRAHNSGNLLAILRTEFRMHDTAATGRLEIKRLRHWAQQCRELSEMTVVPDVTRALIALAEDMEDAAENAEPR
jgi:hypothetical protein